MTTRLPPDTAFKIFYSSLGLGYNWGYSEFYEKPCKMFMTMDYLHEQHLGHPESIKANLVESRLGFDDGEKD